MLTSPYLLQVKKVKLPWFHPTILQNEKHQPRLCFGADIAGINSVLCVYQAIVAALMARQQSGPGQAVALSQAW